MQMCCYWDDKDPANNDDCPPSQGTLECAKRNLDTFAVVGLLEQFKLTLELLSTRLEIPVRLQTDLLSCGCF